MGWITFNGSTDDFFVKVYSRVCKQKNYRHTNRPLCQLSYSPVGYVSCVLFSSLSFFLWYKLNLLEMNEHLINKKKQKSMVGQSFIIKQTIPFNSIQNTSICSIKIKVKPSKKQAIKAILGYKKNSKALPSILQASNKFICKDSEPYNWLTKIYTDFFSYNIILFKITQNNTWDQINIFRSQILLFFLYCSMIPFLFCRILNISMNLNKIPEK